jgi:hypothetical protein
LFGGELIFFLKRAAGKRLSPWTRRTNNKEVASAGGFGCFAFVSVVTWFIVWQLQSPDYLVRFQLQGISLLEPTVALVSSRFNSSIRGRKTTNRRLDPMNETDLFGPPDKQSNSHSKILPSSSGQ